MVPPTESPHDDPSLRDRLTGSVEARSEWGECQDLAAVLKDVTDSARELTSARYGVTVLHDARARIVEYSTSGMTSQQTDAVWNLRGVLSYHNHFSERNEFIRLADFQGYTKQHELPDFQPPFVIANPMPLIWASIYHLKERLGVILLLDKMPGRHPVFTRSDQERVETLSAKAAAAISDLRSHQVLQTVRADLQQVIDLVPVATLVFDTSIHQLTSMNAAARTLFGKQMPLGISLAELANSLGTRHGRDLQFLVNLDVSSDGSADGFDVSVDEVEVYSSNGKKTTCIMSAFCFTGTGDKRSVIVTLQELAALDEAEQIRSEFLRPFQHEFRQSLSSIIGAVAYLQESVGIVEPSEITQYREITSKMTAYIRACVDKFIDPSRNEAGNPRLQFPLTRTENSGA